LLADYFMSEMSHHLNSDCHCVWVDPEKLGFLAPEHMFARFPVFVSVSEEQAMREAVAVLERTLRSPAFAEASLADAPAIARIDPKTPGVLYGFDFHLSPDGPKLIEINTNAGGSLLNTAIAATEVACCDKVTLQVAPKASVFVDTFRQEWERFSPGLPLRRVAIVDVDPKSQYLGAEFQLFVDAFALAGISAVIADPSELSFADGVLSHASGPIDLVYNRLTDFYLQDFPQLAAAYGTVLITPHPRGHALFASKHNLVRLCDPTLLATLPEADRAVLARIVPQAQPLTAALWDKRKHLFFKPANGFGSKAAYRGDKLTRGVFAQMLEGDYIAQEIVKPSERSVQIGEEFRLLKLDVRAYAYCGEVQLFAARLYSGQTTNFRTDGGGFARISVA